MMPYLHISIDLPSVSSSLFLNVWNDYNILSRRDQGTAIRFPRRCRCFFFLIRSSAQQQTKMPKPVPRFPIATMQSRLRFFKRHDYRIAPIAVVFPSGYPVSPSGAGHPFLFASHGAHPAYVREMRAACEDEDHGTPAVLVYSGEHVRHVSR